MLRTTFVRPVVVARAVPKRKLRPDDVKRSIQQAELICYNFEDTPACRAAWDRVEEISAAYAHQREKELLEKTMEELCKEDPSACKEYDV